MAGWGSLIVVLKDAGVYAWKCDGDLAPCEAQDLALGGVWTAGTWAALFPSIFAGLILDRVGSRRTLMGSIVLFAGGACLFGASSRAFPAYVAGYGLMGLTAPPSMLASVHAASLVPGREGLVIALVNGFMDAGALAFNVILEWHKATPLAVPSVFFGYAGTVVLPIFLLALFCWPRQMGEAHDDEGGNSDSADAENDGAVDGATATVSPPSAPAHSFARQVRNRKWQLFSVFFCLGLLKFSWYLGSVDAHLGALGQAEDSPYSRVFGSILPFGVLCSPIAGTVIDKFGVEACMLAACFFNLAHSACALAPSLQAQVASFVCFAIFRSFFFASATAYAAVIYGMENLGKVFGSTATLASVFALLQLALLAWSIQGAGFAAGNAVVLGAALIQLAAVAWIWRLRAGRESSTAETSEGAASDEAVAAAATTTAEKAEDGVEKSSFSGAAVVAVI